jgi:hypothetical protein
LESERPPAESGGKLIQHEVTGTSGIGNKPALRAEMGTFLGLGTSIVLIDAEVFQKKADRIELTMTAAEVKETISKQGAQPKQ